MVPIATWLAQVRSEDLLDMGVQLTTQRFAYRLIAQRVPPDVAAQRREHVRQEATRRGHQLHPETLALCDWTVVITNLPPDSLTPAEALLLLRLR